MPKISHDPVSFPCDLSCDSSTQEMDLGAKMTVNDGRVFRYIKAGGTALVAGKLQSAPASIANHTNLTVAAAAAVGALSVQVTLGATAVTLNQYAGGVVIVNDVDGQGYTYTIKSHPAADASAAVVLTLDSNDPIQVALTTSSQASLVHNQYNGVIINGTTEIAVAVGVAIKAITADQYGWIQTRGPVACLIGATSGIGLSVAASDTTAGAVEVGDGILEPVGSMITAGVDTEYNPVFLKMD